MGTERSLQPCGSCGSETHGVYWTSYWQITHQTSGVNPDGKSVLATPFAAVACSAECARDVIMRRITQEAAHG